MQTSYAVKPLTFLFCPSSKASLHECLGLNWTNQFARSFLAYLRPVFGNGPMVFLSLISLGIRTIFFSPPRGWGVAFAHRHAENS